MKDTPLEKNRSGQFLHNLLVFGRLLRQLGLDINPGRMIDLVQALDLIEIGRKEDFYNTTRSLLVHKREDIPLFDQAFELFWRKPVEEWGSSIFLPGSNKNRVVLNSSPHLYNQRKKHLKRRLTAKHLNPRRGSSSRPPKPTAIGRCYGKRTLLIYPHRRSKRSRT